MTWPSRLRQTGSSLLLPLLATLILVGIVAAVAQELMQTRGALLTGTRRQMAQLDMVFAEQTGRALETVDFLLRGMLEALPPDPGPAFEEASRRRIMGVRQLAELAAVAPDGTLIASTAPRPHPPVWAAARAVLADYAAESQPGPMRVSEPIRRDDGTWVVLLTRRIPSADGSFRGIGVAVLNLQYFEDFYQAVELGDNGAIVLHRRDGTVLARFPQNSKMIGSSFADTPPFRDILSHGIAGTVEMDSPVDGSRRVLAIRALKAFPFAVNVSVAEDAVLRPWRQEAVVFIASVVSVALLTGVLLLMLAARSRQVARLLAEQLEARAAAEDANVRLREQMEERERAEAALRQAQRIEAVGQLTGGVAHDFNNLLTVVLGNIDLLSHAGGPPDTQADLLRTMRAAAERGAMLTGQLLAFARRQPLLPRGVDLNEVIAGMRDLLQSAVGSPIRVEIELRPDLWAAMVDPTQIELVVLNLAINARDAMPAGGLLVISTGNVVLPAPSRPEQPPQGDYVAVAVRDTGTGMAPDVQARAFEPFFTTKPAGAGSGLGLSQVYGLARQSGGGVQIDSAPEAGTTVTIYLPRAPVAEPMRVADRAPPPALAHASRVLLVDDDPAVRATTARLLTTMGYAVRQAAGGEAALEAIRHGAELDVLVTDVAMPEMSGPELARRARALRPDLPLVFLTGYADPQALAGDGVLGRLVRKPFRSVELAREIETALAESAPVA